MMHVERPHVERLSILPHLSEDESVVTASVRVDFVEPVAVSFWFVFGASFGHPDMA